MRIFLNLSRFLYSVVNLARSVLLNYVRFGCFEYIQLFPSSRGSSFLCLFICRIVRGRESIASSLQHDKGYSLYDQKKKIIAMRGACKYRTVSRRSTKN
jgi:hypothetical protein